MLPFFIFILGLSVRMHFGQAFLSALKMGVGFAGVFIAFDFFVANIPSAVESFATARGLDFPVLDVGWPPLAVITRGSSAAPLSTPLIRLAMTSILIITIYTIKCADWAAPFVAREEGLHGVSISPDSVVGLIPYTSCMDALYDRIPIARTIEYNPQRDGSSIGMLAEPMIIRLIIGSFLGLAAGYTIRKLPELDVHIAAAVFILPKTEVLIAEGIRPVTETLKERIQKRFPHKKELNVAVAAGILMENRSVVISGLF
jgi:galactitol PTS system EIIC component